MIRPEPLRAAVLEGRIRPLSRTLALAMLDRCCQPGLRRITAEVVPAAPDSLAALLDRWPGEGTPVPVSGEHAEHTIWGHPDVNALFRAWHDTLHVLHAREFDLSGERAVAVAHGRDIGLSRGDAEILWAETFGQTLYYARYGEFPRLQRAFVVHSIRFGLDNALLAAGEGRFS